MSIFDDPTYLGALRVDRAQFIQECIQGTSFFDNFDTQSEFDKNFLAKKLKIIKSLENIFEKE